MSDVLVNSMADVKRRTKLGTSYLYVLMNEKKLPYIKVGKRRLVREVDLVTFIDSFSQPAESAAP